MKQKLWVFECNLCPGKPKRLEIDGRMTMAAADQMARQAGWRDDILSVTHRCPKCHREGRTEVKR